MKTFLKSGTIALLSFSLAEAQLEVQFGSTSALATYLDASSTQIPNSELPSLRFQLGIFDAGFMPNASNGNLWADNWTAFLNESTVAIPNTGGGFPGAPASTTFQINQDETGGMTTFPLGAKVYLWGYRDGEQTFNGASREWILFSNDNNTAELPVGADPADIDGENWIIPESDATAISDHGADNNFLNVTTSDEQIVGTKFSNTQIQFQTVVPEPSSIMLLSLSGLALLRRKR